jgi:hypothetical protein
VTGTSCTHQGHADLAELVVKDVQALVTVLKFLVSL